MHLTLGSPFTVSNPQRVQGLLDVLRMMRRAWCSLEKKGEKTLSTYVIHLKRLG